MRASAVATVTLFCLVAGAGSAVAATPAPAPSPEITPAYMFLDVPAVADRAAVELGVISFTYDAEAGVPLRRHDPALSDDANVRVTMVIAKSDTPLPIAAKTSYGALVLVETDASKQPVKRLTFHDVKVETVGPDGDEPSTRVVFIAQSVTNR